MDAIALGAPILDQGIRAVNFFNGRLLTSRDLGREQDARREADARLGRAVGAGIAWGLEATLAGAPTSRTVQIKAGLAVNRSGQTLYLASDQTVTLTEQASATSGAGSVFGACGLTSSSPYVAGDALYLLTIAPASQAEGRAQVLALDPGNIRCNTDALVEAVQIRLLKIPTPGNDNLDTNVIGATAVSRLRNRAAYACFGSRKLLDTRLAPGLASADTLLDAMRNGALTDCDVPIAIVYITATAGIVFVDRWAVRRRIADDCASPSWSALIGEELDATAEAELMQFQEQVSEIDPSSFAAMKATDWFEVLPPAGFLDNDGARAVDWRTFFGNQALALDTALAPGDVRAVLAAALRYDPVAVSSPTQFRVYRIDHPNAKRWLFVRNAPRADEVWLDGKRSGLPDVSDVQTAIDILRGRCCRQLVVWPGSDVQARIATVPGGVDVVICFEPGTYKVTKPVVIKALRQVSIHGAGALLGNPNSECALRIENCESVTVTDMAFLAGRVAAGKDETGLGLSAALTIVDTPNVHVERVAATCADGEALAGSCVAVRNTQPAVGTHASIVSCDVIAGRNQAGIQCLNVDIAVLRDNRVAAEGKTSMQRGIVVAGESAGEVRISDNMVNGAVQGIAVGLSKSETKKEVALQAGRVVVSHNSVRLRLEERDSKRNRYGVFVGNADSAALLGNRVHVDGKAGAIDCDGIRLSGVYGRHVVARDNHCDGNSVGVRFAPIQNGTKPTKETHLWLIQYNVAEGERVAAVSLDGELAKALAIVEQNLPGA